MRTKAIVVAHKAQENGDITVGASDARTQRLCCEWLAAARTYNPPVNSRIQPVLPRVAAHCRELLDGAYLSWRQELVTCWKEPRVAARCRELWRPKCKKKATWLSEGLRS